MNINQNPLNRREAAQTPPTPEEREAMRATRERVREGEAQRRASVLERMKNARMGETQDRIEISSEAQRRIEASEAEISERRVNVERLREAYRTGELNTPSRREAAALRMLGGDQG